MNAHYKNGQYGIEVRIPHYLADTDKERLAASVLKDFAGECYEEMRVDPENNVAYKVYKACYNGSGKDLEHFQDLWNYNLVGRHDFHLAHHYWMLMGVKVFPGETLIYSWQCQEGDRQEFYPTDAYEEPGQSQYGIDYARTIMREICVDARVYYPMLIELGETYLYPLNETRGHRFFGSENEAREFHRQYDK